MKIRILRDYDIVVLSCILPDGCIIGGAQTKPHDLLGTREACLQCRKYSIREVLIQQ